MLQKLREHSSGWIAKIILGLLVFVFSFFGIESYFMAQSDTSVAKVGDREVSQQALQDQLNQLRRQPQIDPAQFDRPEFRDEVLKGLINQQLLLEANGKLGVVVSNDAVAQEIAGLSAFQLGGSFDPDTYRAVLAQQGMSPLGFEAKMRDDLAMRMLPDAVESTALVPAFEIDAYLALRDQTRDVRYVDLAAPPPGDSQVSDDEIKAWYASHTDDFMNPETVSVDYIELKADQMKTNAEPDDAAIAARYAQDKHRFVTPEQRLVSHILIAVPPNASPEQQKEALAKADEVEAELKRGDDFAKLATRASDDLGSRRQGGDLGWIEPGMTDKAFDDAVFAMEAGKVSAPVLSPEGYHIIWLREVREGSTRPLAEVRDELARELMASERERAFNDEAGQLTDILYSNPTSLAPAEETLKLEISRSQPFTRSGGADPITSNKDVIAAAFSNQVLAQGQNSDPIFLGADHLVVLHLAQHQPATPKPLAEVESVVRARILEQRAADAARSRAEGFLARVRGGESLDALAAAEGLVLKKADAVSRMDPKLMPQLLMEIFRMPHPADAAVSATLVELGHGDSTLIVLDAVKDGDPTQASEEERAGLRSQLAQLRGDAAVRGMIEVLREHTKVTINRANLRGSDAVE